VYKLQESELLLKAQALEGMSLMQLARALSLSMPLNLLKAKGWVGQAIERFLGAESASLPQPDFPSLNIELKTLPLNQKARVMESTYVTHCSLSNIQPNWVSSVCYQKLKKVLWIPIEGDKTIPLAQRRIGRYILWSPDAEEMQILAEDWQMLMEMIIRGDIEKIHGSLGRYLHIRPKAANAKVLTHAFNAEGESIKTLPRGFYLRSVLTNQILDKHRILF